MIQGSALFTPIENFPGIQPKLEALKDLGIIFQKLNSLFCGFFEPPIQGRSEVI